MSEASRADFDMLAEGIIDDAVWQRFLSLPAPEYTSPVVETASDAAAASPGRASGLRATQAGRGDHDAHRGPFRRARREIVPSRRAAAASRACSGSFPTDPRVVA